MEQVINSVAYQAGKRLGEVTIDDISEVLKQPGAFVWLGLWQADQAFMQKIQHEFNLHELAIEDALAAHQRPKIEVYGDSLFIVLKTVQQENDEISYGETHFFVGTHFLISVRHGNSSGYAAIRKRAEENPKLLAKGPGFALYSVMDFIVDNYRTLVDQLEMQYDGIEASLFKSEFDPQVVEQVYGLRRTLLKLHNAAMPVAEICNQLIHLHETIIPKELRAYIRDVQDHAHQVIIRTDDMREMLANAMNVNLAMVTVRQNEVVKKLAGWGAILAVPTVIFSLYGMNFAEMPELKTAWGYPVTLLVTLTGCIVMYQRLKRSGWL
jgi:magnesium transporter